LWQDVVVAVQALLPQFYLLLIVIPTPFRLLLEEPEVIALAE
jgi:hypothetical protein